MVGDGGGAPPARGASGTGRVAHVTTEHSTHGYAAGHHALTVYSGSVSRETDKETGAAAFVESEPLVRVAFDGREATFRVESDSDPVVVSKVWAELRAAGYVKHFVVSDDDDGLPCEKGHHPQEKTSFPDDLVVHLPTGGAQPDEQEDVRRALRGARLAERERRRRRLEAAQAAVNGAEARGFRDGVASVFRLGLPARSRPRRVVRSSHVDPDGARGRP